MGCVEGCKKFGLIIAFILFEVIDVILNWDFFVEVILTDDENIENDLALRYAVLGFCILGTIFFLFEAINLCSRVCCSKDYWFCPNTISFLSIWMEGIPHICLAMYVAIQEDRAIAIVQYIKAGYAIFQAIARNIAMIYYLHTKKLDKKEKKCKYVVSILALIGGLVIMVCATVILVLIVPK